MTRNPDYWGEAPSLDGFEIQVVPDVNTQVALLQRGDIDLVDSLPPELIGQLQNTAGVEVNIQPGTPVFYLGFNYQNPTWQKPAARQAIASAVNTDVIVQLLDPVAQGSCSIIAHRSLVTSKALKKRVLLTIQKLHKNFGRKQLAVRHVRLLFGYPTLAIIPRRANCSRPA